MSFLPVSRKDMEDRGWDSLDFLYISGDAYVDHPSFGHAIITRLLESEGYKVGIIAQPDWKSNKDFMRLGRPKYAVLISSGVIDSMVNHYTASKKPRSNDSYSPGGKAGYRPDRAAILYANRIRETFKDIPIIIGGIEASLRRFAHYDYWDDRVRRSILIDSGADLLVYGMGEKPILEIAEGLSKGWKINKMHGIRGTAYVADEDELTELIDPYKDDNDPNKVYIENKRKNSNIAVAKIPKLLIPSYEKVSESKYEYARAFMVQYNEQDPFNGRTIVQQHGEKYVVQNPPAYPLTTSELDRVYELPYERTFHPSYIKAGGIPAIQEVEFSITSHRGCYGACSFCALNFHQGRMIQRRSQESIIEEAKKLIASPNFKGYIHDVGGPTANFRDTSCDKQRSLGTCKSRQCLFPQPCKNLKVDHSEYLELLRKLRELPGVKKVFIRSGIRYDYLMLDKDDTFFRELCKYHVSGHLKVAPEHVSDRVLEKMGKPGRKVYDEFVEKFYAINKKIGKEQYLVPYLISSHPGSDLNAAIELALYLKEIKYSPEQVQDFYPTPGTLSTCMFYTGLDPRTMKKVYVPTSPREKAMQRALLQFRRKENHALVREALIEAGREDLIGFGKRYLVSPENNVKFSRKRKDKNKGNTEVKKNKRISAKKDVHRIDRHDSIKQDGHDRRAKKKEREYPDARMENKVKVNNRKTMKAKHKKP
jgi:uncharacterized radical SAM protein YgiQ